ncbi:uncharacterized protein LOC131159883 isoform X1 [Malania oleifera]|uniref:uncharacterized protein LOC131159883 isoform X1 n=1 Tax=Malania oleifera TaxID=397392 RepID=UPI0025AE37F5|nr:uncharacterized protein LOC131159883 isoform X1 [Malania oleifera]
MCDCVFSTFQPSHGVQIRELGFTRSCQRPRNAPMRKVGSRKFSILSVASNSGSKGCGNGGLRFAASGYEAKSRISANFSGNLGVAGSEDYEFNSELGCKEKEEKHFGPQSSPINGETSVVDFLELKDGSEGEKRRRKREGGLKQDEDYLVRIEDSECAGSKIEESVKLHGRRGLKNGRQVMRRSRILAKQVISMQSALSLGFVSQLWVDTASWVVLVVEVRPNLLSGESERFLLEEVFQVGDVVLLRDERVMEYELKMVGLETLVGYNVVTPSQRKIGRVRGYTFNINSGVVESLELDSFGISIIPSNLVTTYALLVEDVLEVVSDTVVVHEAAASCLQRLTKGFYDTKSLKEGMSTDGPGEYSVSKIPVQSDRRRRTRRSFSSQKHHPKMRETEDDWDLPMDYL